MARLLTLLTALVASPALANGSTKIPEPGDAAIMIVAIVGLLIGRHASRKRPGDAGDER